MYTVTISFSAPVAPAANANIGIGPIWTPESYVDGAGLDGTVYDTNKPGFGSTQVPEPFATSSFPLPVPLAQFKAATAAEAGINSFEVDTFAETMYYVETGKALKDQGFTVTVIEATEGGSV